MNARTTTAILSLLLMSDQSLAIDPEDMSPAEVLAYRTYISSVQLQTQVAECKAKLPTWNSEYPDALEGWLKRQSGLIIDGEKSFKKLVSSAAAGNPEKVMDGDVLDMIRKDAIDQISFAGSEYFVQACIAIGEQLRKYDREHKKDP